MWVGATEAARHWGLRHYQAVHKRSLRDPARYPSRPHPTRQGWRQYWIGDTPPPQEDLDATPAPQGVTQLAAQEDLDSPDALRLAPADGWIEREGYVYDGRRDVYVLTLPSHRRPFVLDGARLRQIWRRYAGDGANIDEVCRDFAIDRQTFLDVKRLLRLTKTRAPFTDEELDTSDEAALVSDALRSKERRVMAKAQATAWRKIERLAHSRQWLQETVRAALADLGEPRELPTPAGEPEDCAVIVGWSDLHVGKREAGQSHGLQRQLDHLRQLAADVVARVAALRPAHVFLACTGDLVHSDTQTQTTTKGTPQGPQSEGSTAMALRGACELTAALVARLAEVSPSVEVIVVPGNHDELLSRAVGLYLEAAYSDARRVSVDADETRRRKWSRWREVPLCFFHGDKLKGDRLAALPGRECPRGADPRRAVLLHGHLHRRGLRQDVVGGFDVVCLASPAGADDWHHDHGFEGAARAVTLAVITPSGLTALEWVRAV